MKGFKKCITFLMALALVAGVIGFAPAKSVKAAIGDISSVVLTAPTAATATAIASGTAVTFEVTVSAQTANHADTKVGLYIKGDDTAIDEINMSPGADGAATITKSFADVNPEVTTTYYAMNIGGGVSGVDVKSSEITITIGTAAKTPAKAPAAKADAANNEAIIVTAVEANEYVAIPKSVVNDFLSATPAPTAAQINSWFADQPWISLGAGDKSITGLLPSTEYNVYQRVAATATALASLQSAAKAVTTGFRTLVSSDPLYIYGYPFVGETLSVFGSKNVKDLSLMINLRNNTGLSPATLLTQTVLWYHSDQFESTGELKKGANGKDVPQKGKGANYKVKATDVGKELIAVISYKGTTGILKTVATDPVKPATPILTGYALTKTAAAKDTIKLTFTAPAKGKDVVNSYVYTATWYDPTANTGAGGDVAVSSTNTNNVLNIKLSDIEKKGDITITLTISSKLGSDTAVLSDPIEIVLKQ